MGSDGALVRAAHADPAAFRELSDRYANRVYGFHLARTGRRDFLGRVSTSPGVG
jgi:hypothetical protein